VARAAFVIRVVLLVFSPDVNCVVIAVVIVLLISPRFTSDKLLAVIDLTAFDDLVGRLLSSLDNDLLGGSRLLNNDGLWWSGLLANDDWKRRGIRAGEVLGRLGVLFQ
jgi:hypothetical protein